MAMSEGSVTINPVTGVATGSGFAKDLFDDFDAKQDYQGLSGDKLASARQFVADLCESIATVIGYVQSNATVTTTIDLGVTAPAVTAGPTSSGPIVGGTTGTVS